MRVPYVLRNLYFSNSPLIKKNYYLYKTYRKSWISWCNWLSVCFLFPGRGIVTRLLTFLLSPLLNINGFSKMLIYMPAYAGIYVTYMPAYEGYIPIYVPHMRIYVDFVTSVYQGILICMKGSYI